MRLLYCFALCLVATIAYVQALYLPLTDSQNPVSDPFSGPIDDVQQYPSSSVPQPGRRQQQQQQQQQREGEEEKEEEEDTESVQVLEAPKSKNKRPSQQRIIEYNDGLTVAVESDEDFCLLLPPSPGNRDDNGGKDDPNAIADSEKFARAFCTNENIDVPGALPLPPGFVTSAHFAQDEEKGFVQVRGTIDPAAYSLSPSDSGGQYDDHGSGAPPGSHCMGYPYYVSLIEPDLSRFCIRCCQEYEDCNAGRSEYGCDRVVPEID